jgi:hypothetical protein
MANSILPHLLTSAEVAGWLLMAPRRVERMARDGKIPAVKLPDGSFLFDPDELRAWLDTCRTTGGMAHA